MLLINTPIIFIAFNRPSTTSRVFNVIKRARPKQLYLVCDGPRPHVDKDEYACAAVKKILDKIDWDCNVYRDYSSENMGCRDRVYSGISNAFNHFESAIILEDDCYPDDTFFRYCEIMLEKYKDDERVMHINGTNQCGPDVINKDSICFSRFAHVWGWATWKRAWLKSDVTISKWPEYKQMGLINVLPFEKVVKDHLAHLFDSVYSGAMNTWDFQWQFQIFYHNGICITPNRNLISNIGFIKNSTHTSDEASTFADLKRFPMRFPMQLPREVICNEEFDRIDANLSYCVPDKKRFQKIFRSFQKRKRAIKRFFLGFN